MDISKERIRYALDHYASWPSTQYYAGEIRDAPLDASYECLLLIGLLHHLSDRECLALIEFILPKITKKIVILEPVFDMEAFRSRIYKKYIEDGKYKRKREDLKILLEMAEISIHHQYVHTQTFGLFEFWCGISLIQH